MKPEGMNNPLALAAGTVALDAGGHAVKKGADFFSNNAKPILIGVALIAGIYYVPKWYQSAIAKSYLSNNPGSPYTRASFIIANSVKTFTIPTFFSEFSFNYNTDENSINNAIASVESYKELSRVYDILFGRSLDNDLQKALDQDELATAFDIISGSTTTNVFPIGTDLYVKPGKNITINKSIYQNGKWTGTNELYDSGKNIHKSGEKIGVVHSTGVVPAGLDKAGEQYYIVKDCFFGLNCDYGVVVHSQVTNIK